MPFATCGVDGEWLVLQAARNLEGELFVKVAGPGARDRREDVELWAHTNEMALALAPGSGLNLLSVQQPCEASGRPNVDLRLDERQVSNDPSFEGWFAVRVELDALGQLEQAQVVFSTAPERDLEIEDFFRQHLEIHYPTSETYPRVAMYAIGVYQGRRGSMQQTQY